MPTTILDNNKCTSPFDAGAGEAITIERTGVAQGEWAEAGVPTNFVTLSSGTFVTTESLGFKQPDANGVIRWTFNASTSEGLLVRTAANGWLLPAGVYQVTTRIFSLTNPKVETANIEIVGDATTAITTSVRLRGKKK